MKTIIQEKETAYRLAAEQIASLLREKPDAVLAFAGGRTMEPLFSVIAEKQQAGECSFSEARVFEVAEFADVPMKQTFRFQLEDQLIGRTDLRAENCTWLTEEILNTYDDRISAAGGIDLAVLGIGVNAHIGLNEPATQFGTLSRRQKLTSKTKAQYAWLFGSEENAPAFGLTMGIKTLIEAKQIAVLAFGEEKTKPVFHMLYARTDSVYPAAFLQLARDVNIYIDASAAQEL